MTGTGVERDELATNMSEAWVAFARSGDPNYGGMQSMEPDRMVDDGVQPRDRRRDERSMGNERRTLEGIRNRESGLTA